MNKYQITYLEKGYVRTKNDYSGIIEFEETFFIEANTKINAVRIAETKRKGMCEETYKNSNFEMNFENDEIIRDDTEKTINVEIIYISYKNYIKYFKDVLYKIEFPLNLNKKDEKEIRKKSYIEFKKNEYQINRDDLNREIWNFIDEKYFFPNNIRFDIKKYNLNKIRPDTYFNKKINVTPTLTFYENEIKDIFNLYKFLNDIINNKKINLIKKEIKNEKSNNQKRKEEKQKINQRLSRFESIINENKKEFTIEIKEKLKKAGLEDFLDSFYIDIKIKK